MRIPQLIPQTTATEQKHQTATAMWPQKTQKEETKNRALEHCSSKIENWRVKMQHRLKSTTYWASKQFQMQVMYRIDTGWLPLGAPLPVFKRPSKYNYHPSPIMVQLQSNCLQDDKQLHWFTDYLENVNSRECHFSNSTHWKKLLFFF